MKDNFKSSFEHVLNHEGGWSDNSKDPGGATMKGVTLDTYQSFFGADKSKDDLKNISEEELGQIYQDGYWNKCLCDELPDGVDYAVFDAAVNSGPGRSAKWLQSTVGANDDGFIGPNTVVKVNECDPVQVTEDVCDKRLAFLKSLDNWSTFGNGWERRVEEVRVTAVAMASGEAPIAEVTPSVDYVVVKRGSTGTWVRKVQEFLGVEVDGIFGGGTEAALKVWQENNGLEADGIGGRNTYRAMGLLA